MSRKSRLSASDKGDKEITGLYTDLLAFTLQVKKLSARRRSKEALGPIIDSNEVSRIPQHVRKGEERKKKSTGSCYHVTI